MGTYVQAEAVSEAFDVLRKALADAAGLENSAERTGAIRALAEELQELFNSATAIRKAEMLRIMEAEKLSLAKLADRVGISKARADQIIRAQRLKEANDA